jgi:hypothetical protein
LSKDKDNILQFPNGGKMKPVDTVVDENSFQNLTLGEAREQQELELVESCVDECAISLIKHLVDYGCDINKKHFYGDLGFITEMVRALVYRDMNRNHISQALIDKIITIQYNADNEVQPIINYSKVLVPEDLKENMIGNENDDMTSEKEIVFESDFEFPDEETEETSEVKPEWSPSDEFMNTEEKISDISDWKPTQEPEDDK